jgi:high-affinity nickel-transport protein
MQPRLNTLFNDAPDNLRGNVIGIYGILLGFNLGAWLWAGIALHHYPVLLGTALLAYSFGLRHAVDADHIAAIDNVTRKLMQDGKRPVAIGFMFSLGHSTVVVLGAAAIAGAALALQHRLDAVRSVGGIVGTLVSAFFLFAIAFVNLIILRSIFQAFVRVRRGEPYVEEDFDLLLGNRGFLARIFRPMFGMISSSWRIRWAFCLAWVLIRLRRLVYWVSPLLKHQRAYRSGRFLYFRYSLLLGCPSSIPRTTY